MGARSTRSFMRWGTLGILAFWLVVMAGLYLVMEQVRAPRAPRGYQGQGVQPRPHAGSSWPSTHGNAD